MMKADLDWQLKLPKSLTKAEIQEASIGTKYVRIWTYSRYHMISCMFLEFPRCMWLLNGWLQEVEFTSRLRDMEQFSSLLDFGRDSPQKYRQHAWKCQGTGPGLPNCPHLSLARHVSSSGGLQTCRGIASCSREDLPLLPGVKSYRWICIKRRLRSQESSEKMFTQVLVGDCL